jgi:GxxExxY protein
LNHQEHQELKKKGQKLESFEPVPESDDRIARDAIRAAIEVHRVLGPGFLESVYEAALCHELELMGLRFERQRPILVRYKELQIPGQRIDLLVEGRVIVELKTVEAFAPIHQAKVISYLKTTGLRLGLLINFHAIILKDGGLKRIVV